MVILKLSKEYYINTHAQQITFTPALVTLLKSVMNHPKTHRLQTFSFFLMFFITKWLTKH